MGRLQGRGKLRDYFEEMGVISARGLMSDEDIKSRFGFEPPRGNA